MEKIEIELKYEEIVQLGTGLIEIALKYFKNLNIKQVSETDAHSILNELPNVRNALANIRDANTDVRLMLLTKDVEKKFRDYINQN